MTEHNTPESAPGCFYPVYLDRSSGRIIGIGYAVSPSAMAAFDDPDPEVATCWPIRKDSSLGRWRVSAETARRLLDRGLMSTGRVKPGREELTPIKYLMEGGVARIDDGDITVVGYDPVTGTAQLEEAGIDRKTLPTTMWAPASHSYSAYGSWLLRRFVPGATFSHPKSLYAMEDALRFYLTSRPEARLLDIYAGSGTTAHALMLLNAADGGQRTSTSITINELSPHVARDSELNGIDSAEDDPDGVFHSVLIPRLRAALTGRTSSGDPVRSRYVFPDRFACAEGLPGRLQALVPTPATGAEPVAAGSESPEVLPSG